MRRIVTAVMMALLPAALAAEEPELRALRSFDEGRGWEAVGRVNLGTQGFCTGTLIAPDLVLTAAHCLYDSDTRKPIDVTEIEFAAGLRNGRAEAYRHVRRAQTHPEYVFEGSNKMDRVAYDLALLQLDHPIRLPSVQPFDIGHDPRPGEQVEVVSYAFDRAEEPSLQESCEVLGRQPGMLVLSCLVDFGSSGAPIFALRGDRPEVVSVVSAKAQMDSQKVALATQMAQPLAELRAAFDANAALGLAGPGAVVPDTRSGAFQPGAVRAGGAKFLRP